MPFFRKRAREVGEQFKRQEMSKLPDYLKPLFWDVDFESLSVRSSSHFIMSRLMEHGDEAACRFLLRTFGREALRMTLSTSRSLSRRSRKFWSVLLDLDMESCTAKRYPTPFGECSWD